MKAVSLLVPAVLWAASSVFAQSAPAKPAMVKAKPLVKTTCADYVALDETVKPKFISYAVGYSQRGKPEAVFTEDAVETIKPELDEYCKLNLTKSAYQKVMQSSMASERAVRGARAK